LVVYPTISRFARRVKLWRQHDVMRVPIDLKTIKRRILAFAILATLIPAMGLGLLSFWRYQALISDNVAHELRILVDYTSDDLALWLNERVSELRAFSTSNTVTDALSSLARPRPGTTPIGGYELGMYLRSVQKKSGFATRADRIGRRRTCGRQQRLDTHAGRAAGELGRCRHHPGIRCRITALE
jgi:hypothetical protein